MKSPTRVLRHVGIDPIHTLRFLFALPAFLADLRRFKAFAAGSATETGPVGINPCLFDRNVAGGVASGAYFHQDLLVAQRIFELRPRRHVDIGSRVDGFVAHVASFRPVEVVDIRPLRTSARNIRFVQADVMDPAFEAGEPADSVSCLHALEHFGLGRYGDPIDPAGHLRGLDALHKMLVPGGTLHLAVPVGPLRVEFNAHRIFSIDVLRRMIEGRFRVVRFSYVDDAGEIHPDAAWDRADPENNLGCHHGVAIFELTRL